HTAPGHGQEDYETGLRYGLEVLAPVDARGRFTAEVPEWAGRSVWEASPHIVEHLRAQGALLAAATVAHSYPHCWRCKNPVVFRATEQWFIGMERGELRRRALAEIERVRWIPGWGRERIGNMIATRPDWCISPQRGWFHSALLTGVAVASRAPYDIVITHGFFVDGGGRKMSKSLGNVIAPEEILKRHGAELLRLWVAATDYREEMRISEEILDGFVEAYRRVRNTARFLLGNLYDFDPARDAAPVERLPELERWALHQTHALAERCLAGYEDFEFHLVFHALNDFCSVDLSAFYLDVRKDRIYCERADGPERRATQTVLHAI